MKLRVRGNSLRLRLSRSEVETFDHVGRVEEAVRFGPGAQFVYAMERTPDGALSARLEGALVTVSIPAAHFGIGHGSGAHAPDEYFLNDSTNPKVAGLVDATMGFAEFLYVLAAIK